MTGPLILVAILLVFPIVVGLSTVAIAGVLGYLLNRDAEVRHEGSELLETNIKFVLRGGVTSMVSLHFKLSRQIQQLD